MILLVFINKHDDLFIVEYVLHICDQLVKVYMVYLATLLNPCLNETLFLILKIKKT